MRGMDIMQCRLGYRSSYYRLLSQNNEPVIFAALLRHLRLETLLEVLGH
jgi:hypothetical protein